MVRLFLFLLTCSIASADLLAPPADTALLPREVSGKEMETLLRKGWAPTKLPDFDPATQKPPQWVKGDWVVTDYTADELAAIVNAQVSQAKREEAKAALVDVLIGKGTDVERIERMEKVLAQLIKDLYK